MWMGAYSSIDGKFEILTTSDALCGLSSRRVVNAFVTQRPSFTTKEAPRHRSFRARASYE